MPALTHDRLEHGTGGPTRRRKRRLVRFGVEAKRLLGAILAVAHIAHQDGGDKAVGGAGVVVGSNRIEVRFDLVEHLVFDRGKTSVTASTTGERSPPTLPRF